MASSEFSPVCRVRWAELRFPPVNLWVMAGLAYEAASRQSAGGQTRRNKANTLRRTHRRLETLLAVRGGKI